MIGCQYNELGVIFWGSPLFLAVFGHSHVRRATTLNFGPISTKLGGIVRAIKKMTQKDNGPGPGRNHGETGVFSIRCDFFLSFALTRKRRRMCVVYWSYRSSLSEYIQNHICRLSIKPFLLSILSGNAYSSINLVPKIEPHPLILYSMFVFVLRSPCV